MIIFELRDKNQADTGRTRRGGKKRKGIPTIVGKERKW
jgi:hypothetical protein